jgi:hypothetical protein
VLGIGLGRVVAGLSRRTADAEPMPLTTTPTAPVVVTPPKPKPAPPLAPQPEPVREAPPEVQVRGPPPVAKKAEARKGTLDVHVQPYADVFVDGDLIGTTPLAPIELAPGSHTVLLANSQLDVKRTKTVVIVGGKKARIDEDLRSTP